jgi:hypothetical protein
MDGVHPHWAGHTVMAYALMTAMGLSGDIGTFTVDLKKNKIKVSEGHKVIPVKDGEYEIESFRYPFVLVNRMARRRRPISSAAKIM